MLPTETLKSLEIVLESFLDRAVTRKEERLRIVSGLSRLDDIASGLRHGMDLTDEAGEWFARHRTWLTDETLRPSDRDRVTRLLDNLKEALADQTPGTPAAGKIAREIDHWQKVKTGSTKLVMKRGPEQAPVTKEVDAVNGFLAALDKARGVVIDESGTGRHLLSILDDTLNAAKIQQNRDALLLAGFLIYFLRLQGYLVAPYVSRLKEAEQAVRKRED